MTVAHKPTSRALRAYIRRPRRRLVPPRLQTAMFTVAVLGLTGCIASGPDDEMTPNESGEVVERGDVGSIQRRVGDCLAQDPSGDGTDAVAVVPCEELHDNEVYHTFELPGIEYPGEFAVIEMAEQGCLDAFESFVGAPYETSIYEVSYLYPIEQVWNTLDDRTVICGVYLLDGSLSVGSAAGAAK